MRKILAIFLGIHVGIFCIVFRRPKKCWEKDAYSCAVVCGCPADREGKPTPYMKTRVEKAVQLWEDKRVKYLLLSGGAVRNAFVEAEVMKAYAVSLGVPKEFLIMEKRSGSTYHNMMYCKAIMEECGLDDCVVVTNGWHLRKADHYARKFRLSYVMCKADKPEEDGVLRNMWKYISTNVHMYINMYRGYW